MNECVVADSINSFKSRQNLSRRESRLDKFWSLHDFVFARATPFRIKYKKFGFRIEVIYDYVISKSFSRPSSLKRGF